MRVALPGRGILGANLERRAGDRQSGGDAERGPHGNYDDHETSLQASLGANH